ncbi:molybdopterin molybdotransferase MoeA [Waterburya agarophytonicola K14]|uniref:Molybdopterin molybdenumtransferase n=1 Tax=Waterburya agarophytonicola KI4 TaxID=2874699 RepID=A0A964BT75_9CYAN|nr:gephyrin-like molybdotransferase Glp [Waterburya agarophytonicola]MCC0179223.1 molybdopterin molybdotransferase MoeA [Waterburya agarophytonicola KI4]
MLSVNEVEEIILNLVEILDVEKDSEIVSLENIEGRVLAQAVKGKLDFPHWDNSAMDGYAVRYADVKDCSGDNPTTLKVVTEIAAGDRPNVEIKSGQTARIFTGAMLPVGTDTIVIQENTTRKGDEVIILSAPQEQEFVRHKGTFYQAGTPILKAGIKIGAPEIAVLATAQCTELSVYRRPRVAILSTGDELVTPEQSLQPGQIVDSNQYALASFVAQNGAIPVKLGIVPDKPEELKKAIAQAIDSADIVLSTGGVSVGDYDYVDRILAELGGTLHIRSVAVKPGKPLTVATFENNNCLYFGIPGNPVSALVSCWRFVQPPLIKLTGQNNYQPRFITATTRHDLKAGGRRETYLWGQLHLVDGNYEFALAGGSHSSGNLINLAQTNGLAIVPVGENFIAADREVVVMLVD